MKFATLVFVMSVQGFVKAGSNTLPFGDLRNEIRDRPLPLNHSMCMVSHMESPSDFYIHVIDEEAVHVDHISQVISDAYSNVQCKYTCKEEMIEELGVYCVAYVDKYYQWYRAELVDWFPKSTHNDFVKVQLIDYGHYFFVPFTDLRPMLEEVSHYPRLAQHCHLHNICPVGQENVRREEYTWSPTSIQAYLDALGEYEVSQYEIVFVTSCTNSIGIDLLKIGDDISLSYQLFKSGMAALTLIDEKLGETKSPFIVQQVLATQGYLGLPPMSENEKLSRFFSTALPCERTEDINELVAAYSPTDEKRICKFQEKCRKKNCKFEHAPLTKDYTTDRQPMYVQPIYSLPLVKGGDRITLMITHVKSACNFYIHVNPVDDNPVYSQFVQMDETMNQPNTIKTYKPLKLLPAVGEMVLVKNWEGRWRRAEVQEVRALDDIDTVDLLVFIVDYGEMAEVKLSDVRQVEEDFQQVPCQAVECRLFNAADNPSVDPEEATEYLGFHLNGVYPAQVISVNVGYLELTVRVNEHEDLGEKLIREGFAVARATSIVPAESEQYLVD